MVTVVGKFTVMINRLATAIPMMQVTSENGMKIADGRNYIYLVQTVMTRYYIDADCLVLKDVSHLLCIDEEDGGQTTTN